jgi:signal transduction histidine kinase
MENTLPPNFFAEPHLLNSEEEFRFFLAASFDIVYKMSADWRLMYRLVGKTFLTDTLAPSDTWLTTYIPVTEQPQVLAWVAQAIQTKSVFDHEHTVLQADGSVGWVRSRAVPVYTPQGELALWLGTAIDITPRIHAEQALFTAVQETEENERRRIAEALHNGIGQMLAAIKLSLAKLNLMQPALSPEVLAMQRETNQLLTDTIRQTRHLSHELVPVELEVLGLNHALESLCRQMSSPTLRITSILHLDEGVPPFSKTFQLTLYRIAQELVLNIVKHATGATQACLVARSTPGIVVLRVEDNGVGFAPCATSKLGLGLRNIHDRVILLGGTVNISALRNSGACISIRLPLPAIPAPA